MAHQTWSQVSGIISWGAPDNALKRFRVWAPLTVAPAVHVFPLPSGAASQGSEVLSAPNSLPPSPPAQTSVNTTPTVAFVNLRDLTADSVESAAIETTPAVFPPLPTLSTEDEDNKYALVAIEEINNQVTLPEFLGDFEHQPSFESSFYDFESEDEFGFVTFNQVDNLACEAGKTHRVTPYPSSEEDFSEQSFGDFEEDDCCSGHGLPSPPLSASSCHKPKKVRTMRKAESIASEGSDY